MIVIYTGHHYLSLSLLNSSIIKVPMIGKSKNKYDRWQGGTKPAVRTILT